MKAKKHFGQNFLHDLGVIQAMIATIQPQHTNHFIEIGPGQGALSVALVNQAQRLDLIEIDQDLIAPLYARLKSLNPNTLQWDLLQADVLKVDFSQFTPGPLRIVGNLPYNISTPILFHLLQYRDEIFDMHFMLQQEVVDRLCARPHSKTYGRLSVMVQYYCQVEKLFTVSPEAFTPRPQIYSAVVRLTPHRTMPFIAKNELFFSELVNKAFQQRRKTINNALSDYRSHFDVLGLDPKLRPENLSVEDYVKIANQAAS